MLDFMTWSEIVDDLLREGNVKKAAIFDLSGMKLAASQGAAISEEEVQGLLNSLRIPCSSMYGLFLGGVKVSCLRLDDRTLIGKTPEEVFVAYRADSVLICGYTSLEGKSSCLDSKNSCLGSVKNFALKLNMQHGGGVAAAPSLI